MSRRFGILLAAALFEAGSTAVAECPKGRVDLTAALERIEPHAREVAAKKLAVVRELPNPRAAKQLQATSGASADASPVDNPSLPEILALAIDNELLNLSEQQAFSVSLNPFAFVTLVQPGISENEGQYQRYAWIRRLDGKLTLGGEGEAFDRDGDGNTDEALRAKHLSEQVSWEVRLRVFGSRDRRERSFVDRYERQVKPLLTREVTAYRDLLSKRWLERADPDGCMSDADLESLLEDPALQGQLATAGARSLETAEAINALVKDIDRRLVITLFLSGTRRDDRLGPDKTGLGLRAGWGHGLLDHTLNVDWTEGEGLGGAPETHVLKLGYQTSGEIQGKGFEGSRLSAFGAWEHYSNVPGAKHRDVAKAGGKLEIRLGDGLTLPVSVTWANHRDLLSDANEIVGNVAIALDLSDLRRPRKSQE